MSPTIRPVRPVDAAGVRRVHELAFEQPDEAALVEALTAARADVVSLVAEVEGEIVGHVLFSPVTMGDGAAPGLGLGPVGVLPGRQRRGIGGALIRDGLAECRRLGHGAVVVLGHAAYYPRFGFGRASARGLRSEYDAPDEAFMVLELIPGALAGITGLVRYHPAFGLVAPT